MAWLNGRLEKLVRLAWCCGSHGIFYPVCMRHSLESSKLDQRWFSGLELSLNLRWFFSRRASHTIDEGLLDLHVTEFPTDGS
jgi:hypothetical protein